MANYTNLKAAIAEVIRQNGNNEITGNILQSVLTTMVSTLGMYGQFAGIATPTTNPGNPDQNVFYLTTTPGIYTNFGGITVSGGVQIITNISGQWAALSSSVASIYITEPFNPKFPEENNGKYLMSNGNLGTSSTQPLWRVSEYFSIKNTRSVTLYNTYNNAYSLRYAFYDSNNTFISGSNVDDGDVVAETIYADDYPANAAYMRVAGIDGDGHAKPTVIIGVPLADLNSNFWTLYQQVQDLALAVTGGADSQTVNFLSAYSLVQLGTTIPIGSTITSITGDVSSITGRTNQSDEAYQVLSVGTVTNRNINWVKNNESSYGTCTIGYTVSNGLINRVDGLAALLSQVYDEIYGAVKSETLEYPNAWGTRETSATIKKGSLINIIGALSGTSLVGRTNENDAYGQDLYDGVIADRDINFVRYGETGTLNFTVTSYGILGALSEIDNKIDDINTVVDGEGSSCTVSFIATFQNRELPFTIPQGTEVYISGDITQLNCRTNQNDSTYQIIRNGDVADRNINWVKNQETLGSCTIKIYSNKGLSPRVADLEREMQQGVSAASKKSAYEALRSVKAAGFAKPLKILVAGNSWSLNATNYLGEILASIGIPVKIGVCYVGSGSLMQLWNNIHSETAAYELHIWENGTWSRPSTLRTYQYIVNAEMWDIITHQQVSGDSGIYSTYQPYLHNIIEWEKENIPQLPLFGILATWAYPSTNISTAFIENYGGDTTTMYNAIISAYNQAMTAENIDFVFPCTPVIQQARALSISDIDTTDGTHLATNGYYIASMALAETLLKMYYQQRNTEKWTVSKSTYTIGSLTSSQIESIENLVKTIVSSITTYFTLAKSWPEEIKWEDAMKLYNGTGQNTDGAMTQKAVTDLFDGQYGSHDVDFAIADESDFDIVQFDDGHVKTKNFDSRKTPAVENGDSGEFSIADKEGNIIVAFFNGHIYTKNFSSSIKSTQKISDLVGDTYVIAASDSSVIGKNNSDIICDGVNDSLLIENCIKSIQGSCGTLIFCAGTYNMTFREESESSHAAILIPTNNKQINLVAQHFNGVTHPQVFFKVNQSTYESLESEGIEYSIIKHATVSSYLTSLNSHLKMSGICFEIYDNQKPITCINAQYTGQICMYECKGQVTQRPGQWSGTLSVTPSIDCVFFKGMQGWNHAYSEICRSTCAGFGIGWGVQGEHIYMNTCGAVNCLYGYAFNYYPLTTGMYVHPIILVNCIEECGLNFPYFGANPHKQSILIYNWHIEHKAPYFALGGHYATESTPGQWYGHIDYAIQYFAQYGNGRDEHVVNIPFWAEGCGHSMESINIVHKKIVTTSERNSYAPNYGQVVFDSTLNKECICVDPENKTWVDANGNEV